MLYRLARWYVRRSDQRDERRAREKAMRLFPPGTRVEITGQCCVISTKGDRGTVECPTSMLTDWWVKLDKGTEEIYCAKGMRKL